jgi:hypothetical protein
MAARSGGDGACWGPEGPSPLCSPALKGTNRTLGKIQSLFSITYIACVVAITRLRAFQFVTLTKLFVMCAKHCATILRVFSMRSRTRVQRSSQIRLKAQLNEKLLREEIDNLERATLMSTAT